jgi:hypothetical protein
LVTVKWETDPQPEAAAMMTVLAEGEVSKLLILIREPWDDVAMKVRRDEMQTQARGLLLEWGL